MQEWDPNSWWKISLSYTNIIKVPDTNQKNKVNPLAYVCVSIAYIVTSLDFFVGVISKDAFDVCF